MADEQPPTSLTMTITMQLDGSGNMTLECPSNDMLTLLGMIEMARAMVVQSHFDRLAAAKRSAVHLPPTNGDPLKFGRLRGL